MSGTWAGFRARYRGTCAKCGQTVHPGDPIRWSKRKNAITGKGTTYHAACYDGGVEPQAPPHQHPAAIEPQLEPTSEPEQAPAEPSVTGLSEREVRVIAIEEAHKLDCTLEDAMDTLKAEVERKLASERTITVHIERHDAPTVSIAQAHALVPRLLQVVAAKRHAYLYGPPGSGKSKAAQQVSEALSMRYGYMSLNPQTPESRLLGFIDAGGHYRRTSFRECFEHGGVFCIDEMDNAHPALLNTLNGMVEPGATLGAFPDGVIQRSPEFVLIGTGNTCGRGGDILFPERRALDSAFMERFVFIAWGYDEALERALTLAHGPKNGRTWLRWVRLVRAYCTEHGIRLWATPRASMTGAMFLDTLPDWSVAEVADAVLFKGIDADTSRRVLDACPLPERS